MSLIAEGRVETLGERCGVHLPFYAVQARGRRVRGVDGFEQLDPAVHAAVACDAAGLDDRFADGEALKGSSWVLGKEDGEARLVRVGDWRDGSGDSAAAVSRYGEGLDEALGVVLVQGHVAGRLGGYATGRK